MKKIILVVGQRSNLSIKIYERLSNVVLLSTNDILNDENLFDKFKDKSITLIFNNFQPAYKLNDLKDPLAYVNNSVLVTAKILSKIENELCVNKIIYTSSASVYGNNNFCDENDILMPLNLHASLKITNEKLIESFAQEFDIDYTIARVFNMYGGSDKFSIISKIIKTTQNNQTLDIINNGSAIRDYIHIDDVVESYIMLISSKNINYINIASGLGISVKNILDYLKLHNFIIKVKNISKSEIKISTSSVDKLSKLVEINKFKKVEEFILKEMK